MGAPEFKPDASSSRRKPLLILLFVVLLLVAVSLAGYGYMLWSELYTPRFGKDPYDKITANMSDVRLVEFEDDLSLVVGLSGPFDNLMSTHHRFKTVQGMSAADVRAKAKKIRAEQKEARIDQTRRRRSP